MNNEYDEIYTPTNLGELCYLTHKIVREKKYLLISTIDKTTKLVNIREATQFNLVVDILDNKKYGYLSDYFTKYGAIETIRYITNAFVKTAIGG